LIEIMITVAIIGILAAIAYPSYQEQVAASRRADAARAVAEGVQYMKRYYSAKDTYEDATLPDSIKSPKEGSASYELSVTSDASTFTVTATRREGGNMANDKCGDLSVDQAGKKTITNETASDTSACFRGS